MNGMDDLIAGYTHDPHAALGAHPSDGSTVIRTLRRGAGDVAVVTESGRYPMTRVHPDGIFEATVPGTVLDYRIDADGAVRDDPYRYPPTLGELDLHLIAEGRHETLWTVLGAHPRVAGGVAFAVWAPNARGLRVVGDFTGWGPHDGWPMRSMGASGVWEIVVPDALPGQRYKYRILGSDGIWRDKADPLAAHTETPPRTASVIFKSHYGWKDDDWLHQRAGGRLHREPMSIYEVHLGSWRPRLSYMEIADQLTEYVTDLGFTHVEFMPVMEHPFGGSWGYQVTGYYAPTARFGDPDQFRFLVDRLHQAGIGVLLDWVPAHFPRDDWALARFDGTPLYEHADPRRGEHPDWGTYIFDFGRPEVRNFLVANALYWCEEFHVDGLRVDAVSSMIYLDYSREEGQWVPNVHGGRENLDAISFLQEMNATCFRRVPGITTMAEESTSWPGVTRATNLGGLGFGFKWNMGWMHDTLGYLAHDPVHRQFHHQQMTFAMMYAYSENFVLPLSHDEVVHGKGSMLRKMPGDRWRQLANLRAYLAYMWAHPGKQLIFMGTEIGQEAEWSDERELDWWLLEKTGHAGLSSLVGDLNRTYQDEPALWISDNVPDGFRWIDANDASHNVLSFARYGTDPDDIVVCVANFNALPHENYRLGLPKVGPWKEVVNTDAEIYGGSGVGNLGEVVAEEPGSHGLPASARIQVPPLGTLWLRPG